ncbi:endonuclease [Sutcliffiella horikoshii]|uniref:endonuclease n=1 Tax=Sutcliffiella horikoshii TaxID=79883 RepID=UPI0016534587|nr:endonuclease [Sutcliffiella horikoshii]
MNLINNLLSILPKEIVSLLTGKLLGDANLNLQKGKRPRFYFSHSIHDKQWAFHCYDRVKTFLPLPPPKYSKITDDRVGQGFTKKYYIQSKTCPANDLLKEIWYPNNKKTIPFELLEKTINTEALAWWYQDDGHLKRKLSTYEKIVISTDSFSKDENLKLIQLLSNKFQLHFLLDGQNRLVLYNKPPINYFLFLVEPYIHQSMSRKTLAIQLPIPPQPLHKRTTVYLPSSIDIKHPTKYINSLLESLPHIQKELTSRDNLVKFYKSVDFQRVLATRKNNTKGYQIRINQASLNKMHFIRKLLGITNSQIVWLCYLYEQKSPFNRQNSQNW